MCYSEWANDFFSNSAFYYCHLSFIFREIFKKLVSSKLINFIEDSFEVLYLFRPVDIYLGVDCVLKNVN